SSRPRETLTACQVSGRPSIATSSRIADHGPIRETTSLPANSTCVPSHHSAIVAASTAPRASHLVFLLLPTTAEPPGEVVSPGSRRDPGGAVPVVGSRSISVVLTGRSPLCGPAAARTPTTHRSEEHTSELQ